MGKHTACTVRLRSSVTLSLHSLESHRRRLSTTFLHAAAYGGAAAVAASGNQIFVTLQKGNEYPPLVVDVRVKYEQTVSDIRAAVAKKTGVPADKQQLFWHQKELTAAHDNKTLLEMHLHTGFSLKGYDLVSTFALPVLHQASCTVDVMTHEVSDYLYAIHAQLMHNS